MTFFIHFFSATVSSTEVFYYVITPYLFLSPSVSQAGLLSLIIGISAAFDLLKEAPLGRFLDRKQYSLAKKFAVGSGLSILSLMIAIIVTFGGYSGSVFFALMLLSYGIFNVASGLINISLKSFIIEYSQNDQERQHWVQEREKYRIAGFCFIILSFFILSSIFEEQDILYQALTYLLLLIYLGLMIWCNVTIRFRNPQNTPFKEESTNSLVMFTDPVLKHLLLIQGIIFTIFGFTSIFYVNFVSFYLKLPHLAGLFILIYFIVAIATMRLLSKRDFNPFGLWKMVSFLSAITFLSALFFNQGHEYGRILGFSVVCMITGASLALDLSLPGFYFAKYTQEKNYPPNFSSSIWNIVVKLGFAVASITILSFRSSIDPNSFNNWIPIFYIVIPALLKFISVLFIRQLQRKLS